MSTQVGRGQVFLMSTDDQKLAVEDQSVTGQAGPGRFFPFQCLGLPVGVEDILRWLQSEIIVAATLVLIFSRRQVSALSETAVDRVCKA